MTPACHCLVLSRSGQLCASLDLLDALRLSHELGPGHCVVRERDGVVLCWEVTVAQAEEAWSWALRICPAETESEMCATWDEVLP